MTRSSFAVKADGDHPPTRKAEMYCSKQMQQDEDLELTSPYDFLFVFLSFRFRPIKEPSLLSLFSVLSDFAGFPGLAEGCEVSDTRRFFRGCASFSDSSFLTLGSDNRRLTFLGSAGVCINVSIKVL